MVDGHFRHAEQHEWGPRGMAQPGLFGDLEVVCYFWNIKYKERGAVGAVLRSQVTETSAQCPEGSNFILRAKGSQTSALLLSASEHLEH